ncbi:MAG: hypothetical protein QM680_09770 [Luteolibacter sp.]
MENARFLDRAQGAIFDYLAKTTEQVTGPDGVTRTALRVGGREHFVKIMREFMISEGMAKHEEFKDVKQGDVRDIRSLSRLRLIFDIQVRQAYGYGQWKQGMMPAVLKTYPAARLIRVQGVSVPRLRHQVHLGDVMLKTDPRWASYHNAKEIGGFEVPWGPYGFNSGVNQEDVSRAEAERLGLKVDAESVKNDSKLTDGTQASTKKLAPALKERLLKELRGWRQPARTPEEAAREAASSARRAALNRGLADAEEKGSAELAEKYRLALAKLPATNGLRVRDEGDQIKIGEDVGERIGKSLARDQITDRQKQALTEAILEKINRKSAQGASDLQKGVRRNILKNDELTLTPEERLILDAPHEIVVAYGPDARLIKAVSDFETEQSKVPTDLEEGSWFSHQHPGGRGPSSWDLDYLSRNPHLISRIVTRNEAGRVEIFEITVEPGASLTALQDAIDFYRDTAKSLGDTAPARRMALELLSDEFSDTFAVKSRVL